MATNPPAPANATAPASLSFTISPNDTTPLAITPRGIYVGTSGDINMQLLNDTAPRVWSNVPVGILPVMPVLILNTNTTASHMIGMF